MTNKEKEELGALQRMREFLDHNGRTLSSINRSPSRAELDELVVRVERHEADQRAAEVESRTLTQLLETPRTEWRLEHMQPIAAIANVVLPDTPGSRPILVKELTLVNDARLVANATALARTAAAHRPLFIAQQLARTSSPSSRLRRKRFERSRQRDRYHGPASPRPREAWATHSASDGRWFRS